MLNTNLKHLNTVADFEQAISENENVMICCGRMGPMCMPVYRIMEGLEKSNEHIAFFDMPFDAPDAHVLRNHPKAKGFMGLPFTFYFKNGEAVEATTSIQNEKQITDILSAQFS